MSTEPASGSSEPTPSSSFDLDDLLKGCDGMVPPSEDSSVPSGTAANGWVSMLAAFDASGIDVRPLRPWATSLEELDEWQWGTTDFERDDHYMFWPALSELLGSTAPSPGLSVSHGGHGVNSYGVTIRLVTTHALVLVQAGWGGVYMDAERTRRAVSAMCATVASFGQQTHASPPPVGVRRVLAISDYRGVCASGDLDTDGDCTSDPDERVNQWLGAHPCEPPAWLRP